MSISYAFPRARRQHRYKTLIALQSDLEEELRLMDDIAKQFLKTYQVWHHRRLLLTAINSVDVAQLELEFLKDVLEADTKNYHTWSYRQWLLSHFIDDEELWRGELDFIDNMIGDDIRNNSAWHHRFFTVYGCGVRVGEEDRARVFKRELM